VLNLIVQSTVPFSDLLSLTFMMTLIDHKRRVDPKSAYFSPKSDYSIRDVGLVDLVSQTTSKATEGTCTSKLAILNMH